MDMRTHPLEEFRHEVEEKQSWQPPVEWVLWNTDKVATYLNRSLDQTRDIVKIDGFPTPVCLPTKGGSSRNLYLGREVRAWAESFKKPEKTVAGRPQIAATKIIYKDDRRKPAHREKLVLNGLRWF